MSADRPLAEIVAEGRRLGAAATPGPLEADAIEPYDVITRPYEPVAEHESRAGATLHVFAVNNLAALLDVAEAAAAYQEEMAALGNGVDPVLSAALSALALGPDDEGKEKGK